MQTNWLAFYDERKQFRKNMRGVSLADRDRLARLDVTKAMQLKEKLDHKQANKRLSLLLEIRRKVRRKAA